MSVKEMAANIGKVGLLSIQSLRVRVTVLDVRVTFGRTDFQVSPVDGQGNVWVESSRVKLFGRYAEPNDTEETREKSSDVLGI